MGRNFVFSRVDVLESRSGAALRIAPLCVVEVLSARTDEGFILSLSRLLAHAVGKGQAFE